MPAQDRRSQPAVSGPDVPWEHIARFVGQLTHDVRNGLNSLELQLTYLGEICTEEEAVAEVKRLRGSLAGVTRQLQALNSAVGSFSLQPIEYPAADLFEDLRERFEKANPAAAACVEWDVSVGDTAVCADLELSLAALLELLHNALHFGGPKRSAILRARADGGGVKMTLHETGAPGRPPISTEDWGRQPLQSTRRGAYGIGLFRARRIIEAQGGTLSAAYDERAGALTTTVVLPRAGDPAAPAQ